MIRFAVQTELILLLLLLCLSVNPNPLGYVKLIAVLQTKPPCSTHAPNGNSSCSAITRRNHLNHPQCVSPATIIQCGGGDGQLTCLADESNLAGADATARPGSLSLSSGHCVLLVDPILFRRCPLEAPLCFHLATHPPPRLSPGVN